MRFEFTPGAVVSMHRFFRDQPGMHAINRAVRALTEDPLPPAPDGAHHGDYHRLKVGQYRIVYDLKADLVTIRRVDRVLGP